MAAMTTIMLSASAAPLGQLLIRPNWTWMRLAIMVPSGPPTRAGVTKSPTVGMKISRVAAITPGRESGSVTPVKRLIGPSPRSVAASRSERSIFSSDT